MKEIKFANEISKQVYDKLLKYRAKMKELKSKSKQKDDINNDEF